MMRKLFGPFLLGLALGICCGCDNSRKTLDREIAIAVRGVKGELSAKEKERLLLERHPILAQAADPAIRLILQFFSDLSDDDRMALQKKSYLMWQLSELNALRQTQIATAYYIVSKRALPVGDEELESAVNYLKPNRIGFVEQESPSTGEVVICFYVLFADHSQPAYLTLIGHSLAKLHGELRAEFNEVILQRLASLWSMDDSPAPGFSSR